VGLSWEHNDLGKGNDSYQNVFTNPNEAWSDPLDPSTGDGIDDDNNGYVDDFKGWTPNGSPEHDSRNKQARFHGTKMASVIAAKTNNNEGMASVAGGFGDKGVQIQCCNIGGHNDNIGSAYVESCLKRILLDDINTHIVNISFGPTHNAPKPALTQDLKNYFDWLLYFDHIVVHAAGNDNNQPDFISNPYFYDNADQVLTVAGTN